MQKFWKRLGSVSVAAALCAGMVQAVPIAMTASAAEVIFQSECENLKTTSGASPQIWTDIYGQQLPGYSGDGFVYLTGDTLTMTVEAPYEGMYEISVHYAQILDTNGREQTFSINGTDYMIKFPYADSFQDLNVGRFRLKEGENTIEIKPQYGYACFDTITIQEAEMPDLTVEPTTCDPDATAETKSLMNYLTSVYGSHIISGQQEIYGGGNDGNYELEFDYIEELSGELPAIRGFDFMNYNPLYGWDDNTTERCIEWVKERNGIATACWHINLPTDFANYTPGDALDWTECSYKNNSSFSVVNAVTEGTKENEYLDMAIEDLAEQFTRLQDAGVPLIFRPFHEAEGNGGLDGSGAWFWWAQDGAEAYKALWKYLYNALTVDYGLHNIIWEENLYAWSDESAQWYVGDDYVDIVGYDKYNTEYNRHDGLSSGPNEDAESSLFYSLYNYVNGKKMVAMPENDTIPSLNNLQIEKAAWLYFCPWYGDHILSDQKNNPDTVKELYQSEYCITLDELPADLYTNNGDIQPGTTTAKETTDVTTETTTTTVTTETISAIPGDFDMNGVVNGFDLALARQDILTAADDYSIPEMETRDFNRDGEYNLSDIVALLHFLLGK
ncbi:MAG: glycosyl hydrolase [Ruminococcus sp.]